VLVAGGCGSDRGNDAVRNLLKDQIDLLNLLKKIKNKDQMASLSDQKDKIADKVLADLKDLANVRDGLSDEAKLRMQLRFGGPVENMYVALGKEVKRIVAMAAQGNKGKGGGQPGGPPPGMMGGEDLEIDLEAAFLLDGYAAMSTIVLKDVDELTKTLAAVQKAEAVQGALPTLRKVRHRLVVNSAKLEHAEPRRASVKSQLQDQLKTSLTASLGNLRAEQDRVRTLDGGHEAVSAIEPLPEPITALAP
jgi:hypothetical protein